MKMMKKWKRIFAGLLTLALLMQALPMQVLAAKMPTINTSETGFLTIHKYEYNDHSGSTGTGGEGDTVPDGAQALNNVTFRVTYVDDLTDYYKTDGKALPTVDELTNETTGTYKESYYSNTSNKIVSASSFAEGKWMEIKTATVGGKDGIAKLENLPLGIYLVHEVSAPAQITGKVADFLVSIPMTNATEDDWLYDVHVFPKNSSTYAGVTVLKQGKTGDGTAEALQNAYFILEEKSGTGDTWTKVTKNNKNVAIGNTVTIDGVEQTNVLATGSDGKISVSDLAPGTYRFREIGVPTNSGYILDTITTYAFQIKEDGQVYLIAQDGSVAASPTDTSANPITVTNYKPDAQKDVEDRAGNWDNDADYSVGDIIPYKIKIDVPENVASLRSFKITDTLTNQKFVKDSLKIYTDDTLSTEITGSVGIAQPSEGVTSFELEFNSYTHGTTGTDTGTTSKLEAYHGLSIYIYFEAELTSAADITSVGNPNKIELSYSNKIVPDNGDEPKKDIIHDEAVVYTFKIAVLKVKEDGTSPLENVEFDLYRKLNDGEVVAGSVTESAVNGLPTGNYIKVNSDSLKTDVYGEINVSGLENGTYYLVETKTNDGYNLLKEPVKVEINVSYATSETKSTTTTGGITTTKTEVTNTTFSGGTDTAGVFKTKIQNNKGFTLPTTGGIGTFVFVFAGIALMATAVILFISSKKKEKVQ